MTPAEAAAADALYRALQEKGQLQVQQAVAFIYNQSVNREETKKALRARGGPLTWVQLLAWVRVEGTKPNILLSLREAASLSFDPVVFAVSRSSPPTAPLMPAAATEDAPPSAQPKSPSGGRGGRGRGSPFGRGGRAAALGAAVPAEGGGDAAVAEQSRPPEAAAGEAIVEDLERIQLQQVLRPEAPAPAPASAPAPAPVPVPPQSGYVPPALRKARAPARAPAQVPQQSGYPAPRSAGASASAPPALRNEGALTWLLACRSKLLHGQRYLSFAELQKQVSQQFNGSAVPREVQEAMRGLERNLGSVSTLVAQHVQRRYADKPLKVTVAV
jgi:hypothetical protein